MASNRPVDSIPLADLERLNENIYTGVGIPPGYTLIPAESGDPPYMRRYTVDDTDITVFVFRGTTNDPDSVQNMFRLAYYPDQPTPEDIKAATVVHEYAEQNPDQQIIVTGHSAGGTAALYAASQELSLTYGAAQIDAVAFDAPRSGVPDGARPYIDRLMNVAASQDMVSNLAPGGRMEGGRTLYLDLPGIDPDDANVTARQVIRGLDALAKYPDLRFDPAFLEQWVKVATKGIELVGSAHKLENLGLAIPDGMTIGGLKKVAEDQTSPLYAGADVSKMIKDVRAWWDPILDADPDLKKFIFGQLTPADQQLPPLPSLLQTEADMAARAAAVTAAVTPPDRFASPAHAAADFGTKLGQYLLNPDGNATPGASGIDYWTPAGNRGDGKFQLFPGEDPDASAHARQAFNELTKGVYEPIADPYRVTGNPNALNGYGNANTAQIIYSAAHAAATALTQPSAWELYGAHPAGTGGDFGDPGDGTAAPGPGLDPPAGGPGAPAATGPGTDGGGMVDDLSLDWGTYARNLPTDAGAPLPVLRPGEDSSGDLGPAWPTYDYPDAPAPRADASAPPTAADPGPAWPTYDNYPDAAAPTAPSLSPEDAAAIFGPDPAPTPAPAWETYDN